jgi:hypothetical protein
MRPLKAGFRNSRRCSTLLDFDGGAVLSDRHLEGSHFNLSLYLCSLRSKLTGATRVTIHSPLPVTQICAERSKHWLLSFAVGKGEALGIFMSSVLTTTAPVGLSNEGPMIIPCASAFSKPVAPFLGSS